MLSYLLFLKRLKFRQVILFSHLPIEKLLFFRSYLRHYQLYYQSAIIVSLLPEYEEEGDQLEDSTLDNNAFALNTPVDAEDSEYGS